MSGHCCDELNIEKNINETVRISPIMAIVQIEKTAIAIENCL